MGRYLKLLGLAVVVSLLFAGGAVSAAAKSRPAKSRPTFQRVGVGGISWVAAGGHYAFYVKDRYAPAGSGQARLVGTAGILINERTGRRTRLSEPGCAADMALAWFGGPWLLVECATSPTGAPLLALYNLAGRRWRSVTLDQPGAPGGLCALELESNGGCSVAGLGRFWIEFEVTCYHCANSYVLQPIPAGPLNDPTQVSPGGNAAYDLNSRSGVQSLCSPLTYPRAAYQLADGTTSHQPGWIQPLGRFALAADSYPSALSPSSHASLARCGSEKQIKLPSDGGIAATTRDVAWWTPAGIHDIRLPSLKQRTLRTPAGVYPTATLTESPIVALSAGKVYVESNHSLWAAPLP